MATTPEAKVKQAVKALLKRHGAYVYMPVVMRFGAKTVDFLVCAYGQFVGIETKRGYGEEPTPLQAKTLCDIAEAGGKTFVIHGTDDLGELASFLEYCKKLYTLATSTRRDAEDGQ